MSSKLNTHFYDGKLSGLYKELVSSIPKEELDKLSIDETQKELIKYVKENKKTLKFSLKDHTKCIQMINQLCQNTPKNNDTKNNIQVKDLLPMVWHYVKEYDPSGKCLFFEQILEIYNGPCPQGRTTRLLQCVEKTGLVKSADESK